MGKRCIGIDIGSSHVRAVQVSRTAQSFSIEKALNTQTRRSSDSLAGILRSLITRYGFDKHADVAVSMPSDTVFFRNMETDSAAEEICRPEFSLLQDNFPVPTDEIVAQMHSHRELSDEKCSALVAATRKTALRERLDILAEAKIQPKLLDAPIFAIHSAVALNHPEIAESTAVIAAIDESNVTLAVTQNNDVLIVRNIPTGSDSPADVDYLAEYAGELLARETEITWRKLFDADIPENTKIYLVCEDAVPDNLKAAVEANLPCHTIVVDPYAKVESSPKQDQGPATCLAEGLALRLLLPEKTSGVSFLDSESANIVSPLNMKKEFTVCAVLVAAIAVVSMITLFVRLTNLEKEYANTKTEIKEVFRKAVPDEKNIVSPLAQLQQNLQSLRTDYRFYNRLGPTDLTPLEVLRSITVNTPSWGNLKIDDMLITPESVRLSGTCDSFESAYKWQGILQKIPGFALVDVKDVQKDPKSGAKRFTIVASSAQTEQN